MKNRRFITCFIYLALGIMLWTLGYAEIVDEFWTGMGTGLVVVGVLRLIRMYRFRKDENYREKITVEIADERNKFIRNKAWAWSGYMFVMILCVAGIGLKIAGQEQLSLAACYSVCLMLILYWICYWILRKKY